MSVCPRIRGLLGRISAHSGGEARSQGTAPWALVGDDSRGIADLRCGGKPRYKIIGSFVAP
jgi:hypothetical protein